MATPKTNAVTNWLTKPSLNFRTGEPPEANCNDVFLHSGYVSA